MKTRDGLVPQDDKISRVPQVGIIPEGEWQDYVPPETSGEDSHLDVHGSYFPMSGCGMWFRSEGPTVKELRHSKLVSRNPKTIEEMKAILEQNPNASRYPKPPSSA